MKLGIMQPYFVPYIGYWQLMNAVDKYVIYDDVNFIKGGWINRNRILINGKTNYFNIPMMGASPNKLINEVNVNKDERLIRKNLRTIEGAYKRAPYYQVVYPIIERIFKTEKENIAEFIYESFQIINDYLGIETELIMSSTLNKECSLKGEDKVLAICKELGATEYYNAIGGQKLYSFEDFRKHGIALKFVQTEKIVYEQFGEEFKPDLSIIDVMMFNSSTEIRKMLGLFTVIEDE
ncbi:WbqC-like protein family protein [uncultured Blautia sp.]